MVLLIRRLMMHVQEEVAMDYFFSYFPIRKLEMKELYRSVRCGKLSLKYECDQSMVNLYQLLKQIGQFVPASKNKFIYIFII